MNCCPPGSIPSSQSCPSLRATRAMGYSRFATSIISDHSYPGAAQRPSSTYLGFPLYLALCFLFDPLIGIAAMVGGVLLFITTLSTEVLTRSPTKAAAELGAKRNALLEF